MIRPSTVLNRIAARFSLHSPFSIRLSSNCSAIQESAHQQDEFAAERTKPRVKRRLRKSKHNSPQQLDENEDNTKRFSATCKGFWKDEANHRKFFDWAAKQLHVQKPADWYNVTREDIFRLGGSRLIIGYYNGSLQNALAVLFPEHEWMPWRFSTVPKGYWSDAANRRKFFDWAAKQLGVEKVPDDWYKVSREDITKLGGGGVLQGYYNCSLHQALQALYPEHEWHPWRFLRAPSAFWSDKANHRKYFDWLAVQLGVKDLDDWYKFSRDNVVELGAGGLLDGHYSNSLHKALASIYPEHDWQPWRFSVAPMGFWNDVANQRRAFDWLATQLNVKTLDDWYTIAREDVVKFIGNGLLDEYYDSSLSKALVAVYPEHDWMLWRFSPVPRGLWSDEANHRKFLKWVESKLNITKPEDWYNYSREDFVQHGGVGLLQSHYNNSLFKLLSVMYPDYPWMPWRFQHIPSMQDEATLKQYIEFLSNTFRIRELDDWYRVSLDHIRKLGGYSIISLHGGLFAVLNRLYPSHPWDPERLYSGKWKRSTQRWLRLAIQKLLPNEEIFEEFHHPCMAFSDTTANMTLDLWIPSLSLAFEYHGAQHYHDVPVFGNPGMVQDRDIEKIEACKRAGITLIVVPYWWNRSVEDLAATICATRSDLADAKNAPSPLLEAAANGTPIAPSLL